jgi:hypothetical protein
MKNFLAAALISVSTVAFSAEPFIIDLPKEEEKTLLLFSVMTKVCGEVFPGTKLGISDTVNEAISDMYGQGDQAQKKYQAFLARPDVRVQFNGVYKDLRSDFKRDDRETAGACRPADKSLWPAPASGTAKP